MVSVLTRFYDAEPQVGALQLRFATLYQKPAFIPVYETGHSVSSSKAAPLSSSVAKSTHKPKTERHVLEARQ